MLAVISPAKTLDFSPPDASIPFTQPDLLDESEELIAELRKKSAANIGKLMSISDKLADLNHQRYQDFETPFTPENSKQAILAFQGDVYQPLELDTYKKADYNYAQKHVRILSGLYGVLRPLDLMQAYRLEMGTKLKTDRGKSLYDFWGSKVTNCLNEALGQQRGRQLINLASNEYFNSVKTADLEADVITPVFKDLKKGKYVIVSFYAKKARGMMINYMVRNRSKKPDDLKAFDTAGYSFNGDLSDEKTFTFTRDEPA
ncbi:MAG: peroxide stress protein YaaA [Planctomycetaceae bacterium]